MNGKRIIIILIIMQVIFAFTSSNNSGYQYAANWNHIVNVKRCDEEPINIIEDESLTKAMKMCKELILQSDFKNNYAYFNWERFMETNIAYVSTVSFDNDLVVAEYNQNKNLIMINVKQLDYFKQYIYNTIIHELIHTLTSSDEITSTMMHEGLTQYLTIKVAKENNLQYCKQLYYIQVNNVEILKCIFGEKKTIEMICKGELEKEIDTWTDEGMGKKYTSAMYFLSCINIDDDYDEYIKLVKVTQDILCHLAVNYSRSLDNYTKKKMLNDVYSQIELRNQYFFELMESK